jgi:hypothetical protein
MDGTFSTSSINFKQVFIIEAVFHGTCKLSLFNKIFEYSNSFHNNVLFFISISVTVVYELLPDRKPIAYIYLLNILLAKANKFNKKFDPLLIMTDFELDTAKAISLEVQLSSKLSKLSD